MRETPEYLEAPDNEDSGDTCKYCDEPSWDEGRYEEMCFEHHMEAYEEEAADARAEARYERDFDDDWRYDD